MKLHTAAVAMTNIFKIDFDELWNQLEEEQSTTGSNQSMSNPDMCKTKEGMYAVKNSHYRDEKTGVKANVETMGIKLEGSHQRRLPEMEFSESSFSAEFLLKNVEQTPCSSVAVSTNAYSSSGSGFFIPGITGTARCLGESTSEFSNNSPSVPSGSSYFIPGITGTARCLDNSTPNSSFDIPSTPRRQWQGSGSSLESTHSTPRRRVRVLSKVVLSDQEQIQGCTKSTSSAQEQTIKNVERSDDPWEKNSTERSQRLHTSPVLQHDMALLGAESVNKVSDLFVNLELRIRELERREKKLKKKKARARRELGK